MVKTDETRGHRSATKQAVHRPIARLGVDLGSSSVNVVVLPPQERSDGPMESVTSLVRISKASRGQPLKILADTLEHEVVPQCEAAALHEVMVAVTGTGQDLLTSDLDCSATNEVVSTATGVRALYPETRTVLDLGGQFTKWIRLSDRKNEGLVAEFSLNGLCAAGSGAFLEQQASRLHISLTELSDLALAAKRGATIAGRCSVFAKSDMIHLQQKGTPPEEIAYGLCLALARTFVATVMSGKEARPPVVLAGGGARNPGLLRAFRHVLKMEESSDLTVPDHPDSMGALGACLVAAPSRIWALSDLVAAVRDAAAHKHGSTHETRRSSDAALEPNASPSPQDGRNAVKSDEHPSMLPTKMAKAPCFDGDQARIRTKLPTAGLAAALEGTRGSGNEADILEPLRPPGEVGDRGIEDPGDDILAGTGPIEVFLGVDVGSVSTNLVALTPDGRVLQGIYLATKGRPVEVLSNGLTQMRERFGDRLKVLAAGATGSGRHLAERLMGMDVVHNEITAQMVSAARYVPDVDTIFEIGGQDSKYIGAEGGHLSSFEMNKICAAGTGSFLEEQAERLGVNIITEFAERAFQSKAPYDLGSQCTVFMDTALVQAMQEGVAVEDLCAGLAYSIAKNYLERVVTGRPVGNRIVFSGGTASNQSVVAAFSQLLAKPVQVHPYNRIAGAMGAALLAQRRYKHESGHMTSRFMGLDAIRDYSIRTFECRRCPNLCQVNRVMVGNRVAHFGDACDRYSGQDREHAETGQPSLHLFERRAELFAEHMPPARMETRPSLGIPVASLNHEFVPMWATFLDELGFTPVLSGPTTSEMLEMGGHGLPAEVCLPLKLAAGHVAKLLESGLERIFMPSIQELPSRGPTDVAAGCIFAQLLPQMVRMHRGARILAPEVCLADEGGIEESARTLAEALDRPVRVVRKALHRAMEVQLSFHRCRVAVGREGLTGNFDRAVVVIGKPYNVHDPFLNLDLARHLDRLGIPAIPFDVLSLEEVHLDERWKVLPWRFNRDQLRAMEFCRQDHKLFPLIVSNYGCGPDAFTLKHVQEAMAHKPHMVLEFDEHRGEAGMVTRLEAFADEIDEHLHRKNQFVRARHPVHRLPIPRNFKKLYIPYFSEHAHIVAALVEAVGIETEILPYPDHNVVQLADEVGTGRECHPYNLIGADLIKLVKERTFNEGDAFYAQGMVNPCLLTQYGDGYRYLLRRLGETTLQIWDPRVSEMEPVIGVPGLIGIYTGFLAIDMLIIAYYRLRPYELVPGSMTKAHEANILEIADAIRNRTDAIEAMAASIKRLRAVPLKSGPRRPVIGIVGDLYTRVNTTGNADLFNRLENMGCEVWLNPYFAGYEDITSHTEAVRHVARKEVGMAMWKLFFAGAAENIAQKLRNALDPELQQVCVEPTPERLRDLAAPYIGQWANPILQINVGKMVDFMQRGAVGVINAIGLNCMIGITTEAALQAIRKDHPEVPLVTLTYGGSEGPSQRIRLETFVHQVMERATQQGVVSSEPSLDEATNRHP